MRAELARHRLLQLISGYFSSQAIACAAELRIADELKERPQSVSELAERIGCSQEHLRRLFVVLTSIGLLEQTGDRFQLTSVGNYLRRDLDDSMWSVASFFGTEMYNAMRGLPHTVRTGEAGWTRIIGTPPWEYLRERPDRHQVFDEMMSALCRPEIQAILDAYDFSPHRTVVDVGGGNGSLLFAILEKHREIQGVLFDLPEVIDRAQSQAAKRPEGLRCRYDRGDFFRGFECDGEVYVLRHVVHDWDDHDAITILRNCSRGAPPGARFLIIEEPIEPDERASQAKFMDLALMNDFGGMERTVSQYEKLFGEAGLEVRTLIPTSAPLCIFEAVSKVSGHTPPKRQR
jgi:hypothetical protein